MDIDDLLADCFKAMREYLKMLKSNNNDFTYKLLKGDFKRIQRIVTEQHFEGKSPYLPSYALLLEFAEEMYVEAGNIVFGIK